MSSILVHLLRRPSHNYSVDVKNVEDKPLLEYDFTFDVPDGTLNVLIEVLPNEEDHSLFITMLPDGIIAFDKKYGTNLVDKANIILNNYFGDYLADGCENVYAGVPVEKFEEFLD